MRHACVVLLAGLAVVTAACGDDDGAPVLPADTVAPRVAALTPTPLAQDVSRDETITVAFTEPINPATVGPASFLVTQTLDTVPGAYAFGDSTVSFVPDAPLRAFTTYSARLSRGIRDPAGNQLARDTAWSFLTGSEADPAAAGSLAKRLSESQQGRGPGQDNGPPVTSGAFLHVKGPEILSMWLGESERMVRDLFEQARARRKEGALPFIFIDEAESIVGTRRAMRSFNISNTLVPMF